MRYKIAKLSLFIAVAVTLCCCGHKEGATADTDIAPEDSLYLALPTVPDSISDQMEQFRYVTLHFWDDLDFNDTTKSASEDFMGRNFANYALFLSHEPDSALASQAVKYFLAKTAVNVDAFDYAQTTARHYLADPNSPMRDDVTWVIFLDALRQMSEVGIAHRARYDYEHSMMLKNRPGFKAGNFAYVSRDDKSSHNLYSTPIGSHGMMLVFYDPECDHCKEILSAIIDNKSLDNLINEGVLTVLAIDTEDNRSAWENAAHELPAQWIVGFNTDNLREREAYYLPAMPSIYLLDDDYRVVAKDISLYRLLPSLDDINYAL